MKQKQINNYLKIICVFALVLIGFSVFYYLVIFLPKKEELRAELEKQALSQQEQTSRINQTNTALNRTNLEKCLDDVNTRTTNALDTMKGKSITDSEFKIVMDLIQKQKDECFKKYPIN